MEPVVIKWQSGNFSNGIRRNDTVYTIASSIVETSDEEVLNTEINKKINVQIFGDGYSIRSLASISCEQPIRLRSALSSLLPSGALNFDSTNGKDLSEILNRLSSIVVLRDLDLKETPSTRMFALRKTSMQLGDPIKVLGLPFNNEWNNLFKMMLWRGSVCGLLTADLLVIDSRSLPGIEGGLLLDASNRGCGVCLSALDTRPAGNSGLILVARPDILWRPEPLRWGPSLSPAGKLPTWLEAAAKVTVFVSHRGLWGTGVVLAGRYVVTCAHVVHHEKKRLPSVLLNGSALKLRRCLFVSEVGAVFDVAIFELRRPIAEKILVSEGAMAGQDCFVLGFGIFPSSVCSQPMFTQGGITKVNSCMGRVLMMQTDCIVNSGCSGAGVFLKSTGDLVAMVVCNLSDDDAVHPNANFCIPMTYISHSLSDFSVTKNIASLHGLGRMPPAFRKIWIEAFSPVPKSKL